MLREGRGKTYEEVEFPYINRVMFRFICTNSLRFCKND